MSKEFHWAEANKFALETAKTIFLLSNGATIAILALFKGAGGPPTAIPTSVKVALVGFMVSAVASVAVMALGYLTNLHYGNSEANSETAPANADSTKIWQVATKLHFWAYGTSILAVLGVFVGMASLVIFLWC